MKHTNDHLISKNVKIALYGDSGVGKTALAKRWGSDCFHETYQTTLGADFESKRIASADLGLAINLQIWDIDGQTQFESMLPFYLNETKWVVLVFSVTDSNSFHNLVNYFALAHKHVNLNAKYVILANKSDLEDARQVTIEEAHDFAKLHKAIYIETSAKNGQGLQKLEKKILEVTAHIRKKGAGVKAPEGSLSMFGAHCKNEGFDEGKAACSQPEALSVTHSQKMFADGTKVLAETVDDNLGTSFMH